MTKCRDQRLSVEFSNNSFDNQVTYQIYVEHKVKTAKFHALTSYKKCNYENLQGFGGAY